MTKREAERYAHLSARMDRLGVGRDDFEALLRIERTLSRWSERECNGEVEVDESGKAFACFESGSGPRARCLIRNMEASALKRLSAIMAKYPKLAAYQQ